MNHSNTLKIFLPHYLGMFTVFRRVYSCGKANTLTNFITQECDFFFEKAKVRFKSEQSKQAQKWCF